jgi:hypothetical protein
MNLLLVLWTVVTIGAFLFGLAHVFFPDELARRWQPRAEVDAQRRWDMQTRGAVGMGIGFFLCWILVEGGGLLRWMQ